MPKAFEESLAPVQEITLALIEPDPELAARNKQRTEERRVWLGPRWLGHQIHAAQRKAQVVDVRTTIRRAQALVGHSRQHADNVRLIKQKEAA